MRNTFFPILVAVALSQISVVHADDDLFSQVAMESVFEKTSQTETSQTTARQSESTEIRRVTAISSVLPILKASGLKPVLDGDRIDVDVETAGWIFPVTIRVDIERERLLCELGLVEISKPEEVKRQSMLSLMAAGDPAQAAFFAFDPDDNMIRLRASLSNRNVTASGLKADLDRLGRFADSQSSLWSELGAKTSSSDTSADTQENGSKATGGQQANSPTTTSPATTSPATNSPTTNSPATNSQESSTLPRFSIEGQWSASVQAGEAFAVRFDANGRFALVHLKAGKSTKSMGSVTQNGQTLVLKGDDGMTLNCKLSWADAKSFQLTIQDAAGKPGVQLNFKKQS